MADKKKGAQVPATKPDTKTLPVAYEGFEDYEGQGFQNQTSEDVTIPFMNLLQKGSPEVDKNDPAYVKGAEAGLFQNSVTKELHDGFDFVPAITQHVYVEWVPRDDGGGLVGQFALNDPIVKAAKAASEEFGKYKHPENGNDLVETFYVFGILCDGDAPVGMALLAFTSKKIKSYKGIMGRLNSFQLVVGKGKTQRRINPPLFAHRVRVVSKPDKNQHGSFFVTDVMPAVENDVQRSLLSPEDPRFLMAAECQVLVDSGNAKVDTAGQDGGGGGDREEDPF